MTFVCNYRPQKDDPYRVRIIVGGDKLTYDDDAGSPASNLLEAEIMIYSTILDAAKGAQFMYMDLKYHFLVTPLLNPEYMQVKYRHIPTDIREMY